MDKILTETVLIKIIERANALGNFPVFPEPDRPYSEHRHESADTAPCASLELETPSPKPE